MTLKNLNDLKSPEEKVAYNRKLISYLKYYKINQNMQRGEYIIRNEVLKQSVKDLQYVIPGVLTVVNFSHYVVCGHNLFEF